ncbi:MAG TPA: PAS domain S-box protein [Spirochaetota bacterium]|nr:PAS domain S-box protein [Spirochaetota bacterium]
MKDFIAVVNREFDALDKVIHATEKVTDENIRDLIISNVELSTYLNASRDLIFRINRFDRIIDYVANQDYLGLNLDQFKDGPVGGLPLCDDAEFFSNALKQVRDLKLNLTIEYPVIINGEEVFLNARFMPILQDEIVMVIRDITGEKRALKDLLRSEKNFRRLLEILPYPVAVHKNLELVYVNDAAIRLIGAEEAGQIVGTNLRDYIHAESLETVNRMFREHVNGADKLMSYREKIVDLQGNEFYVNLISSIVTWGDDSAILVIGRNITDEILMQERLVRAEEMYRILAERMSDSIWMIDSNKKILYINPVDKRITGYDPEDYEKIGNDRIFPAPSLKRLNETIDDLLSKQTAEPNTDIGGATVEMEVFKKGGGVVLVEVNLSLAAFGRDNPVVIGVVRDITERKTIENELRKAEKWRELLLATTPDIIYMLDTNGIFTYISPRVREVTGHPEEEFIGRRFSDFIEESEKDYVNDKFKTGIDRGQSWLYQITVAFDNGDRIPMEINVSTMHDKDGTPIGRLGVARDTSHKMGTIR